VLELQQSHVACCDHGTIAGHHDFQQEATKAGLRPLLGVEAYYVEDVTLLGQDKGGDRRKGEQEALKRAHLTLIPQTQVGYRNLLALVSESFTHYHRKPLVDRQMLARHCERDMLVLSGCVIGHPSQLINLGRVDEAAAWLAWMQAHVEHFLVEIIPCPGLGISEAACPVLWRLARQLEIPLVVTSDAHAPRPEDMAAQDTLLAVNLGQRVNDPHRSVKLPTYHHRCSGEEILARCQAVLPGVPTIELVAAIERSVALAERCVAECPKGSGVRFTVPAGFGSAVEMLRKLAWQGLKRITEDKSLAVVGTYHQRLERELTVVCEKQFADYFLVVADLVREMRARHILIVPRGSAGGSLLLHCLGVTVVDPIKHNLPFERFLDQTRADLPDIDLDLQHDRRHEAFEYLEAKYGVAHVAHVATLSRFGARQALLDVGKAYDLPEKVMHHAATLVPEGEDQGAGLHDYGVLARLFETSEKAQKLLTYCPQLAIAAQLEGQVRQFSVHAGGALLDDRPLAEVVAVGARPGKERTAQVDMATAAAQGLLKIDLLGSRTLTAVAETLQALGKSPEWLYALPLEDPAVLAMLAQGQNLGIFQLQGRAAGNILRELQPANFEEFTAVSALARPGPLQSGGVKRFVARKWGREEMPTLIPELQAILGLTYGTVVYQEQAMALAQLAGLPIEDVHKIRKLASKSGGADAIEAYRKPLGLGWYQAGVPVAQVIEAFLQVKKAANYLFCEAHACQYAYLGAWTGYLKVHHPGLFTAALCRHVGNLDPDERRFALLREFLERGGRVSLLNPTDPAADFTHDPVDPWRVRGGLVSLRGCAAKSAAKVLRLAPRGWQELLAALPKTVREPLAAVVTPAGLDSDVLQHLACWYPLRPLTPPERAYREQLGLQPIRWREVRDDSVTVLGRVTERSLIDLAVQAKKYGSQPPAPGEPRLKLRCTLTDESGSVDVGFSAKAWKRHQTARLLDGPGLGLGNTWLVRCWQAPDGRLYAQEARRLRRWRAWKPDLKTDMIDSEDGQ
jgi:DNA polymerase-3 subunit alpha